MKHFALICIIAALAGQTAQAADPQPPKAPEQITVTGTQEKVINDFVQAYAAPVNSLVGQLARWNTPICTATSGLSADSNIVVTDRVKEIAAQIGAKVDTASPCKTNLQIIFTRTPQELMDQVREKSTWLLGSHYKAEEIELATVRHPIQAWYATSTADNTGKLTLDDIGDISGQCTFTMPSEYSGQGNGRTALKGGAPVEINAKACAAVKGSRGQQRLPQRVHGGDRCRRHRQARA